MGGWHTCMNCDGFGALPGEAQSRDESQWEMCGSCQGTDCNECWGGTLWVGRKCDGPHHMRGIGCEKCFYMGRLYDGDRCPECKGTGVELLSNEFVRQRLYLASVLQYRERTRSHWALVVAMDSAGAVDPDLVAFIMPALVRLPSGLYAYPASSKHYQKYATPEQARLFMGLSGQEPMLAQPVKPTKMEPMISQKDETQ